MSGAPTTARAAHRDVTWSGFKRPLRAALLAPGLNHLMTSTVRLVDSGHRGRRLPVNRRVVTGRARGATFRMLDTRRCANAKDLFWGRGRPTDAVDRATLEHTCQLAREADVLLDIGAHTGLFSLACSAANPRLRVHAFEIVPEVFSLLFANCVENDVLARVRCHHIGVGDPGTVLRLPPKWRGAALPSALSSRTHDPDGVRIPFEELDAVRPHLDPQVRLLVKIDVEGTEGDVLASGAELLAEHRPTLMCELLPQGQHERVAEILEPLRYRWYEMTAEGPVPRPTLAPRPGHRDWLLAPVPA